MPDFIEEQLFRPPHAPTRPGSDAPLTVLFSLLARADETPASLRRRGAGFNTGGFGNDPHLGFEHWGEYWRKVHAVRLMHAEEPDDATLGRLLRYAQLHRFAPGPTSTDYPPYRAPADAGGKLWPTIVGHVAPYRRPRWDGVAYLTFATPDDIGVVFGNDRVRQKIIPEDLAMFGDIAPLLARQHVVIASTGASAAVTLVKLHVRHPAVTRNSFQRWWKSEHARVFERHASAPGRVRRYVQLHHIGPVDAGQPFYHPDTVGIDGVSLIGFAHVADLEDFLLSSQYRDIVRHEATMVDQQASEFWTTIELQIVNRLLPEVAGN